MKMFIVGVYFRDTEEALARFGFMGGGLLVEAWTTKGARRKFRRILTARKIPDPHWIKLDTMEVLLDSGGNEVLDILDREIWP